MNLTEKVTGVVLSKACSIKADKDDTVAKTITLRVKFDGCTLADVFEKAMVSTVIAYQAKARKIFAQIVDKSTVTIDFSAPSRVAVDPMQVLIAEAQARGVSVQDLIAEKLAQLKK